MTPPATAETEEKWTQETIASLVRGTDLNLEHPWSVVAQAHNQQIARHSAAKCAQIQTSQSNAELWREELTKADRKIEARDREIAELKEENEGQAAIIRHKEEQMAFYHSEEREIAELKQWKKEQMIVAADTHYHEIAKLIGLQLGDYIAPKILPAIKAMQSEIAVLRMITETETK